MGLNVLCLHDSSLPALFTTETVTGKEMRLIQELDFVDRVYAISRGGSDYVGGDSGAVEPKIEVTHIPFLAKGKLGPAYYLFSFSTALRLILRRRIDIIHAESPLWSGPVAIILCKLFRRPCIVEIRANYDRLIDHYYEHIPRFLKRAIVNGLRSFCYRYADHIVANSSFHRLECLKSASSEKVSQVNPGLTFDDSLIEAWKKSKDDRFTIGFIGRLVESKGVGYLLKAADYMVREKGFQDFTVLIVGEGKSRQDFEKLAGQLGLEPYVRFAGQRRNLEWISKFDVLINPSLEAPALDMVNIEAYACKVPVIAFGEGGLPETVLDGQTGFIVKPASYKLLAEKIILLHDDPALRAKLAKQGYEYLMQNYSFESQVKRLAQVYRAALRDRVRVHREGS